MANRILSDLWLKLGGAASYTASPKKLLTAAHHAGFTQIRLVDVKRFLQRQPTYMERRQIRRRHKPAERIGRFMVTGQSGITWSADTIHLLKGTFSPYSLALSIIDNHSRFAWIFPQIKSNAENTKKAFLKAVEENNGRPPKILLTDRFVSNGSQQFFN